MEQYISNSTDSKDYEVLIRKRGDSVYAAYCPQLNFMIKGTEHEGVRNFMKKHIEEHIKNLNKKDRN